MTVALPSRYEDLTPEFRAQLRPNRSLIDAVKSAYGRMQRSGGVRFLPVFGLSGAGKTSAARELGTHLPDVQVIALPSDVVEGAQSLDSVLPDSNAKLLVAVVDQFEEGVARREEIPSRFVETLSRLDRAHPTTPVLFLWLTTSQEFQRELVAATSRNSRLLVSPDFTLEALAKAEWPDIIEETFAFHNESRELADYQVLRPTLEAVAKTAATLGAAIEEIGDHFSEERLQDLSEYQVVMLWPVTDGVRLGNVRNFTNPRAGYRLDWNAFYRALNNADQRQLPLGEYNKTRLYFDVRLVPMQVADLHSICRDLTDPLAPPAPSYLDGFRNTHFYWVVNDSFPDVYRPLKDHGETERARTARAWYPTVNTKPNALHRRLASTFTACGLPATFETGVSTQHARTQADVLVARASGERKQVIVEVKAFSSQNTTPSQIALQIRSTLKKHAELAGYLQRR